VTTRFQFKPAVIGVTALTLLLPLALNTGCGSKGQFVTNLYRYYPENVSYYVELNTKENHAKRILGTLDKLGQKFNASTNTPKKLAEEYPKYFENNLSVGLWVDTPKAEKDGSISEQAAANAVQNPHVVVAIPVKSGVTFDKIQTGLEIQKPVSSTLVTKKSKVTAYSISAPGNTDNTSVMAIVNNTLLVSEDEKTLQAAIEQSEGDKNIGTNEAVTKHLGALDAGRQGTIVSIQQPTVFEGMVKNAAPESKSMMLFLKQIQEVAPVSVGSIKIDDAKHVLDITTLTPLDFSKITNSDLRKELEGLMTKNQTLSLPATISQDSILSFGIYGLSNYYDIYMKHFATDADKKSIQQANDQLKMMNLDVRKNIVALFDETSAISITSLTPKTELALLLNSTEDTKRTLDQVSTMLTQMAQGKLAEATANGKAYKTLEAPGMPFKLAFGEIQPKVLAIGTLPAVQVLPALSKGPSLENNGLYKDLSQGVPASCYSFVFVNLDALTKQIPDFAEMKDFGLKGALAVNVADKGKNMFTGQLRIKWDEVAPATK
jgi:hypothetical protein